MIDTIAIERLGQRGDGIGRLDGALVHVAGALPGETVAGGDGNVEYLVCGRRTA